MRFVTSACELGYSGLETVEADSVLITCNEHETRPLLSVLSAESSDLTSQATA